MNKNIAKIKQILDKANISQGDQDNFINSLTNINEDNFTPIFEVLENNPEHIKTFLDFFAKKQSALKNHDQEKWKQIINEEIEFLKKISKG